MLKIDPDNLIMNSHKNVISKKENSYFEIYKEVANIQANNNNNNNQNIYNIEKPLKTRLFNNIIREIDQENAQYIFTEIADYKIAIINEMNNNLKKINSEAIEVLHVKNTILNFEKNRMIKNIIKFTLEMGPELKDFRYITKKFFFERSSHITSRIDEIKKRILPILHFALSNPQFSTDVFSYDLDSCLNFLPDCQMRSQLLVQQAICHYNAGENNKAYEFLKKDFLMNPQSKKFEERLQLTLNIALTHLKLKNYQEAQNIIKEVFSLYPFKPLSLINEKEVIEKFNEIMNCRITALDVTNGQPLIPGVNEAREQILNAGSEKTVADKILNYFFNFGQKLQILDNGFKNHIFENQAQRDVVEQCLKKIKKNIIHILFFGLVKGEFEDNSRNFNFKVLLTKLFNYDNQTQNKLIMQQCLLYLNENNYKNAYDTLKKSFKLYSNSAALENFSSTTEAFFKDREYVSFMLQIAFTLFSDKDYVEAQKMIQTIVDIYASKQVSIPSTKIECIAEHEMPDQDFDLDKLLEKLLNENQNFAKEIEDSQNELDNGLENLALEYSEGKITDEDLLVREQDLNARHDSFKKEMLENINKNMEKINQYYE